MWLTLRHFVNAGEQSEQLSAHMAKFGTFQPSVTTTAFMVTVNQNCTKKIRDVSSTWTTVQRNRTRQHMVLRLFSSFAELNYYKKNSSQNHTCIFRSMGKTRVFLEYGKNPGYFQKYGKPQNLFMELTSRTNDQAPYGSLLSYGVAVH